MSQRRDSLGCFTDNNGSNCGVRRWLHSSYNEYLTSKIQAADEDCKSVLLNKRGEEKGVNGYRLLDPRNRLSFSWASEELKDWLQENGDILTFTEFKSQVLDMEFIDG